MNETLLMSQKISNILHCLLCRYGNIAIRCQEYLSPPKLVGKDKKGSDK